MNAQTETQTISLEYELPHPPAKVWRALTDPALLKDWLMPTDMKPVVGNSFQFKTKPMPYWDGIVNCEVLELEPNKRLSYTWKSGPPSPLDTVVTWILTPTSSGGTLLSLEHSGFQPSDEFASMGARQGWDRMVNTTLRELLARAE